MKWIRGWMLLFISMFFCFFLSIGILSAQEQDDDYEGIDSGSCVECHETSKHETEFMADLEKSVHAGFECLDCHSDKNTMPHKESEGFLAGRQGCGACHEDQTEQYKAHGRTLIGMDEDVPTCSECHGDHVILSSQDGESKTNPANLMQTCGSCHKNLDLIEKHQIRNGHPVDLYESSIHGTSIEGGELGAAACNDCHSSGDTSHNILSHKNPESSINHFNIPATCGKCHEQIRDEYSRGIHGQLVEQGDLASPVCTNCHGEHGIISPSDPRSPVSSVRLAEATCTPCHESISLTEKYGVSTGRRPIFIDNYHGLKSQSGDLFVANCASCHGVHMILPSTDSESSIHADKLQATCGECHPAITTELAAVPIHGLGIEAGDNKVAGTVKLVYIVLILVVIGGMAAHWTLDFIRQAIMIARKKPQVRRMRRDEVWQHTALMLSFIVLVVTGFALRFGDSWFARLLFGFDHGFATRGIIHRTAAVVMIIATIWHAIFLFTRRGKGFIKDMVPQLSDFKEFIQKVFFDLGWSKVRPNFKRFSYVEKAEYWALIWGNGVMILTGLLLWFDNMFIRLLSPAALEVALVIHFYEAILATLAIIIWHLYSTVFNPHVYPMNPSWVTGKMPEDMFRHEHPGAEIEPAEDSN